MLNFYGRKSPRRLKKKDVLGLFNNSFFFIMKISTPLINFV